METVAHLQLMKFVQSALPTLAKRTLPVLSKPVAFTSTKVPVGELVGISTAKCLMPSSGLMGCIECGLAGA